MPSFDYTLHGLIGLRGHQQLFQPVWFRKSVGIEQSQPFPACQARPEIIGGGKAPVFAQPLRAQDLFPAKWY